MFIDTHCHLYLKDFEPDFEAIVKRAFDNKVEKMILPNIDSASVNDMFKICENRNNFLFPTLGLHPTSVNKNYKVELDKIFKNDFCNIVAIGEIGIDLYWDKTFIKEQKEVFDFQLNVAVEKNIPIIVHSRNSMNEIFEILKLYKNKNLNGIFHCYPGSYEQAKKAIEMGFYLGVGGVVTFKNAGLQKVVDSIPLEYIMLETDAPYLTPAPHRGERNEPAYIKIVAEKVSEIKKATLEDIEAITTNNVKKIFNMLVC